MDGILKRLGTVEALVADIRVSVGALTATVPHLAARSDLDALAGRSDLERLATREDLHGVKAAVEVAIIKWFVGTAIAIAGVVFAIARYLL